jgi:Tol biopolymer transport system component
VLWVVGVDQETGRVTVPMRSVRLEALEDDVLHAEWLGSSDRIGFSAIAAPDRHALYEVPRDGGVPKRIHAWTSPQRTDGFGASADGRWLVFVGPGSGGRLQLFRIGVQGGAAVELTRDDVDKTQPAVSPDGRRIAYTEWSYRAQFRRFPGVAAPQSR